MRRRELLRDLDAEALRKHGAQCLDLHLAEAGERLDPATELIGIRGLLPEAGGVAVVLGLDVCAEIPHAGCHRAREAVDRRPLAKRGLELVGVG
jgi:hypothetical protein